MSPLHFLFNPATLLIVGFAAALLGLVLLLAQSWLRRHFTQSLGLSVCVLAALATALPLLGTLAPLRIPLVGLTGVCAAFMLPSFCRSGRLLTVGWRLVRDPRLQGGVLLLAAPMVALGWSWQLDREATRVANGGQYTKDDPIQNPRTAARHIASTDRGTTVPVFDVADHETRPADQAAEARLIESHDLTLRVIQVSGPDRASNCHGWVYTGGRYHIDGGDVYSILSDNGYEAVSDPRAGDLVIYRDHGVIMHSAVVRTITDRGQVILQSKWSYMGCFLHAPQDYPLADSWTFYRSPRAGHLLSGLPEQ
jgi:hypothetical protein